MLNTELYTRDIPLIYQQFAEVIGANHWHRRVRHCEAEVRGNPFLEDFLKRENSIAFQLNQLGDLLERYQQRPPIHLIENRAFYPAMRFASQILSMMTASMRGDAEGLRRRVHGALSNPDDLRGLMLELTAATHFLRRGRTVRWPEMDKTGTFDLLIEDMGNGGLEVECKSISPDKGRRIHRREAIDFQGLMKPHLKPIAASLEGGLCAVLTLPNRLPTAHKDRQQLAKEAARAILIGKDSTLTNGETVRIKDFDPYTLGPYPLQQTTKEVRGLLDKISETDNREAMIIKSRKEGIFTFFIQSQQDDNLLKAMFDTLSDASKRQLTKKRAGLLLASLEGIDSNQLRSLGQHDESATATPTAIRVGADRFLRSEERNHLVGVGFLASEELVEDPKSVESGGAAYYFQRRESQYWSTDFSGLFHWDGS